MRSSRKIMFIMSNFIGDAVLASGVLEAWRKKHPQQEFIIVGPAPVLELFREFPPPVSLWLHEKSVMDLHWLRLFWRSFLHSFDYVIDFRRSLVGRLIGGKWVEGPPKNRLVHKIRQYRVLLPTGAANSDPDPRLRFIAALKRDESLPRGAVILAVGSSWPAKSWHSDRFIELGKLLSDKCDFQIGVAADGKTDWARPIFGALHSAIGGRALDLVGRYSITEMAEIIRCAKLVVSNDSGLMHIAAAAGCPLVALFGPSSELEYGPWAGAGADAGRIRVLRGAKSWDQIVASSGFSRTGPSAVEGIKVQDALKAALAVMRR